MSDDVSMTDEELADLDAQMAARRAERETPEFKRHEAMLLRDHVDYLSRAERDSAAEELRGRVAHRDRLLADPDTQDVLHRFHAGWRKRDGAGAGEANRRA